MSIQNNFNNVIKAENNVLDKLQKYFEKDASTKPVREIKFTTSIRVNGTDRQLSNNNLLQTGSGEIIVRSENINRDTRHNHSIEWKDIENSYKLQEAIHAIIAEEYEKSGKTYKGRRLYQQINNLNIGKDNAGIKTIRGTGSQLTVKGANGYGFGHRIVNGKKVANYGKLDIDIQKRVLDKIYSQIYKSTNKHLFDKFNETQLSSSGTYDFNKLIKVTGELVYDLKNVKNWAKEVENIVRNAEVKYEAQVRELERHQIIERPQWLLSIEQLEKIGKAILGRSTELCPIETGFLRSSGKLYVSSVDIRIIYECPYGAFVHDNPNVNHAIGQYHFLVDAAQEILPNISVWTETTGNDSFVLGNYMKQTWDKDSIGNINSDMYWKEHKGYKAVYIDIDRNLKINYTHYR